MTRASDQHLTALQRANEIRLSNAALRQHLHSLPEHEARRTIIAVLRDPGPEEGAMPVARLLGAINGYGPGKVRRVLLRAGVRGSDRRVRELTPRQLGVIVHMVADPAVLSPYSTLPRLGEAA